LGMGAEFGAKAKSFQTGAPAIEPMLEKSRTAPGWANDANQISRLQDRRAKVAGFATNSPIVLLRRYFM
jgi:hypothetical protein